MNAPHQRRDLLKLSAGAGLASLLAHDSAGEAKATTTDALHTVTNRDGTMRGNFAMPANFGPQFKPSLMPARLPAESMYGDVTTINVVYRTSADQLRQYLPLPFELTGDPTLRVYYSMNRDVDWLAGGAYNLMGVDVSAEYRGKVDHVWGSYCLVLWENQTEPILTGRDRGIPKIFGDIPDHQIDNGVWSAHLSHGGHSILDIEASDLHPLSEEAVRGLEQGASKGNWFGWRYVPSEGAEPLASYATCFPTGMKPREAWAATGRVKWHKQTWAQNPMQAHIINALEALPIESIVSCLIWKGSSSLRGGAVRRLA